MLPVLLVVFGGIVEYSWYFFQQARVLDAVRTGARVAITHAPSDSPDSATVAVDEVVAELELLGFSGDNSVVTAEYQGTAPELRLNVTCRVPYSALTGLDLIVPDTIGGAMAMFIEAQ